MESNYDPRIAEARRLARRIARERGTSYQSELDAVAKSAGASSWSGFVEAPTTVCAPAEGPAAAAETAGDASGTMTRQDKDLLVRLSVGMLATALTVVLGTGLLMASVIAVHPWSTAIETAGTLLCAAGVLAIPSGMSGYAMGVRIADTGHVMPIRWRLAMAVAQGWFVIGVARHLLG